MCSGYLTLNRDGFNTADVDLYLTPKARILDLLLQERTGTGIVDTIRNLREEGHSLRQVAVRVSDLAGERISYESVLAWSTEWGIESGAAA